MTRLVEINPEAVRGIQRDVTATRDAIESELGPLRRAAADLGVPLGGFDDALLVAERLHTVVLPVVLVHRQRAEDLAAMRYSGDFGATIPVVDLATPAGAGGSGGAEFAGTAGSTRITWAAASAAEETGDAERASAARSISDWFGDRWSDVTAAVDDGADWVAQQASAAWTATAAGVSDAVTAVGDWWESTTATAGTWIDENLDGAREWIGRHVGAFRWLAKALRIVGWVVVVVGVVLTVALAVIGAMGGTSLGAVFGLGVGAVPGGAAGALAGAIAGLKVVGVGFTLVGAGDLLDTLADWGDGTIDGQDLVQQGALELGMTVTSLLGVGAVAKAGQKLLDHLPAPWVARFDDWLRERLPNGTRDPEPEAPRDPDVPGNPPHVDAPEGTNPDAPAAPHGDAPESSNPYVPAAPHSDAPTGAAPATDLPDTGTPRGDTAEVESTAPDSSPVPDHVDNPPQHTLPDRPPRPTIESNDAQFAAQGAHTLERHGPNIPLTRAEAAPDGRSLEGRIYGDDPWREPANASSRWIDEITMNRTIQQHIETNWEQMRKVLDNGGTWSKSFDTGKLVGEGFYNSGMRGMGPRSAVYTQTSRVHVTIKTDGNGDPFVYSAYPEIYPKVE